VSCDKVSNSSLETEAILPELTACSYNFGQQFVTRLVTLETEAILPELTAYSYNCGQQFVTRLVTLETVMGATLPELIDCSYIYGQHLYFLSTLWNRNRNCNLLKSRNRNRN
jgi:hypothetical protein